MRLPLLPFWTVLATSACAAVGACGLADGFGSASSAAPVEVAEAAGAATTAAAASAEEWLVVGPALRSLAVPLPEPVLRALRGARWDEAGRDLRAMPLDALKGAQKSDWAFLVAWCATHGEHPESAADVLPLLEGSRAPEPYLALVRGEVLLGTGQPLEALPWLDRVGDSAVVAPRAALRAADALHALGRTADAREKLRPFGERADPSAGNAEILLRLAEWEGIGSDGAYPLLRRIWTWYPGTEAEVTARGYLTKYAEKAPTWQQSARRAEAWLDRGDWDAALDVTSPILANAAGETEDACRLRFVHGRALYKKNSVTDAAAALAGIGEDCAEIEEAYGARGLYLLGTALYRRKRFAESAAAYRLLPELYADNSMADDGLTRGGISLVEAGREDEARKWWEEALERFPTGDTVPEALLRLAFARYLDGDPEDAREIATRLGRLPLDGDATSVQAGRYWAARWRLYPDASAPNRAVSDASAKAEAIAGFVSLCEELPHSFYAIQAYSRLVEIAPDEAARLAKRRDDHDDGSVPVDWRVRLDLARDPHVRAGVALIRLGLPAEGLAEWRRASASDLLPEERAWLTELRIAAEDWLFAHDEFRRWIHEHPLSTLGPNEPQIIRVAYPNRYWSEVQASVKPDYQYEPRLFHALVREESNFNREIISFAGARGLSQLMPATARQTAGWLKMELSMPQLFDPSTNLTIGGRYLDAMHRQLAGSPYLALAAYNGGAANVNKWVAEDGNPPTDEYVERIPFEETRGYVKRVMGTWQTMRYRFDLDAPAFPDLSRYNHRAKPE
jgi:soluble lytic murein transglycosylase